MASQNSGLLAGGNSDPIHLDAVPVYRQYCGGPEFRSAAGGTGGGSGFRSAAGGSVLPYAVHLLLDGDRRFGGAASINCCDA